MGNRPRQYASIGVAGCRSSAATESDHRCLARSVSGNCQRLMPTGDGVWFQVSVGSVTVRACPSIGRSYRADGDALRLPYGGTIGTGPDGRALQEHTPERTKANPLQRGPAE